MCKSGNGRPLPWEERPVITNPQGSQEVFDTSGNPVDQGFLAMETCSTTLDFTNSTGAEIENAFNWFGGSGFGSGTLIIAGIYGGGRPDRAVASEAFGGTGRRSGFEKPLI